MSKNSRKKLYEKLGLKPVIVSKNEMIILISSRNRVWGHSHEKNDK